MSNAFAVPRYRRKSTMAANEPGYDINMSEQQLRDLRQIFDWLDVSGDGAISAPELVRA